MSNIRIKPGNIISAGVKADKSADYLNSAKINLNSIKCQIDPQILSKNNISGQFSEITNKIVSLEKTVKKIKTVTNQNINDYANTEKRLVNSVPKSVPKIR